MKKIIFITGSTDGIGKLTALNLAKAGHEVILHGRNPEKLQLVISELESESGSSSISGYLADLADLAAVRKMGGKVKADHPRLDVLINNAGVYLAKPARNAEGMDFRFLVNYLAPVLLTRELMPALAAAENARVISLSSAAQAPVSIPALQGVQALGDQAAYAQSKLALTMWNTAAAGENPNVVFIAVNPGSLLNTKMVKEAFGRHYAPADKGADILLQLATSADHADQTGRYFDNDRGGYGRAHPDAYDKEEIAQLLRSTEEILETSNTSK